MSSILTISEETVLELLDWDNVFKASEAVMKSVSSRKAVLPERPFTGVSGTDNFLLTMPGYFPDEKYGALGCKLVTVFPDNPNKNGLPSILANVMLFDEKSGALQAVSDWNYFL